MNWNESATDTVSDISLGDGFVGSTNHSMSMINNVFLFSIQISVCCEEKQSSTCHKFSGLKQQLIPTESTVEYL